jgi:hypothetical protein
MRKILSGEQKMQMRILRSMQHLLKGGVLYEKNIAWRTEDANEDPSVHAALTKIHLKYRGCMSGLISKTPLGQIHRIYRES